MVWVRTCDEIDKLKMEEGVIAGSARFVIVCMWGGVGGWGDGLIGCLFGFKNEN